DVRTAPARGRNSAARAFGVDAPCRVCGSSAALLAGVRWPRGTVPAPTGPPLPSLAGAVAGARAHHRDPSISAGARTGGRRTALAVAVHAVVPRAVADLRRRAGGDLRVAGTARRPAHDRARRRTRRRVRIWRLVVGAGGACRRPGASGRVPWRPVGAEGG